ncbi:MAG: GTP cyclohydrolase I FolE2 [Candidatus Ozemobacteraceae bacterium]
MTVLHDTQNTADAREIPIDLVGVTGLRMPITVLDRGCGRQETIARISLSASLPHHFKGTHMSRFVEILNRHRGEITMNTLPSLLSELRRRLSAERARIEVAFPYFLERAAPASGAKALMDFDCVFTGESGGDNEDHSGDNDDTDGKDTNCENADKNDKWSNDDFLLTVTTPVTSVCPCSKSISDYGAHNQRGIIRIEVRPRRQADGTPVLVWIEELIAIAEASASAPVYPLLKRPDERYVTMQAFDNPVFVEDMVRGVAVRLKADPRMAWFKVHAENHESIHNHNAFACLEWTAQPQTRKRTW